MKQSERDDDVYELPDGEIHVFVNWGHTITLAVEPDDGEVPVALTASDARELAAILVRLADELETASAGRE